MHFIGMLAYKMDQTMQYDLGITLISVIFAVIVSGLAPETEQDQV